MMLVVTAEKGGIYWDDLNGCDFSLLSLLLMEEILHQLISSLSPLFTRFYTSQVLVEDFFHQQYHFIQHAISILMILAAQGMRGMNLLGFA